MPTTTIDREILSLERAYWDAMKSEDKQTLERLTDNNCIVAGAQGIMQLAKGEMSKMVDEGAKLYKLHDFKIDDSSVKLRHMTDDVVAIAYKAHEDLTVEGKPVKLEAYETSVWTRNRGQWACTVHTETLEGDPFGRAMDTRRA